MTIEIDADRSVVVGKLNFAVTCWAVPEQYDVYKGTRQVGYVRARGGHFRVSCPDHGGEDVLHQELPHEYQGMLDDEEFERIGNVGAFTRPADEDWRTPARLARLQQAADAINAWIKRTPP